MFDYTISFRIGGWIGRRVRHYFLLQRAATWVYAEATVTGHRFEDPLRDFPYAAVTYSYIANDEYHSGEFRHYLSLLRAKKAAEKFFALYPRDTRIAIKFDPQHPERSVKE